MIVLVGVFAGMISGSCIVPDPGEENVVKSICDQELVVVKGGERFVLPACETVIGEASEVRRAVIIIPGSKRDAAEKHGNIVRAASARLGEDEDCVILHPQYLIDKDVRKYKLKGDYVFWQDSWEGWKYGYPAISKEENRRISSFEVTDSIIAMTIRKYPRVNKIVIAGHSAGGQFVNRYAAANRYEGKQPSNVKITYVAANPSSWLYFNQERFDDKSGKFRELDESEKKKCKNYNDYKFGLEDLEDCEYVFQTGKAEIIDNFRKRDFVILLGEKDNDRKHPSLDRKCPSDLQGLTRLERGEIYFKFLKHFYGNEIERNHKKVLVPGVEHSTSNMFTSAQGFGILFN